jgi:hypothetical protein
MHPEKQAVEHVGGLDASKSSVKECGWQLLLALCTAGGDWPSCTTISNTPVACGTGA